MSAPLFGLVGALPSPADGSLSLGPLEFRAYGIMTAFGVIAAVWLFGRQRERAGLGTGDDASSIAMWAVFAGVIGARPYHVATDWGRFSGDLASIPKVWQGRLGIPGGLLAGVSVGAWRARTRATRPPIAPTFAAPRSRSRKRSAAGATGSTRNCTAAPRASRGGSPSTTRPDTPPARRSTAPASTSRCGTSRSAVCCLWAQHRYRLAPGHMFALYLAGYGGGRFWIEGLCIEPAHVVAGLRLNQWVDGAPSSQEPPPSARHGA